MLASLPGSDSELRNEWVIIGAHLDHVSGNDDAIYNGADDNASGIAGLLEIAEAFAASPKDRSDPYSLRLGTPRKGDFSGPTTTPTILLSPWIKPS